MFVCSVRELDETQKVNIPATPPSLQSALSYKELHKKGIISCAIRPIAHAPIQNRFHFQSRHTLTQSSLRPTYWILETHWLPKAQNWTTKGINYITKPTQSHKTPKLAPLPIQKHIITSRFTRIAHLQSWRWKLMETTVYQSKIRKKYISSISPWTS